MFAETLDRFGKLDILINRSARLGLSSKNSSAMGSCCDIRQIKSMTESEAKKAPSSPVVFG
jgi:hypothetical protein